MCDVALCERWAVSRADRPVCDVRASCKRWAVSRADGPVCESFLLAGVS